MSDFEDAFYGEQAFADELAHRLESADARVAELETALRDLLAEAEGMDVQIAGEWGVGPYTPDPAILAARTVLSTPDSPTISGTKR